MAKRENRSRGLHLVIIGTLLLIGSFSVWAFASNQTASAEADNAGLIVIDGLKQLGVLQRPPVLFPHDEHTRALAKQGQDCLACHPENEGRLSLKFKRADDRDEADRRAVMDLYHDNCIACHQDLRSGTIKSGPATCGECHLKEGVPPAERSPMPLDKYLHFRHTRALEDRCDLCHHQYDEQAEKLVYVKGREDACFYCHKEQTEGNRISNRQASHIQCITCHQQRTAQNQTAGPIECQGCHDPELQKLIKKPAEVPRLARNQPNVVLVKRYPPDSLTPAERTGMGPVPFDHRAHEINNDSCRVCHHADLSSCVRCHTRTGAPEGGQIELDQAMHRPMSEMSCVGCHRTVQDQTRCAGCHHILPPQASLNESTCKVCHTSDPESIPIPPNEEAARSMTEQLLAQRPSAAPRVATDRIPETVTISHLVDEYEAVVMPHRKIVLALADGTADSQLAARFHTQATTLCQGCHHNSPDSLTPPTCMSCHNRTFAAADPTRPGLLAAYHRQCMDCHEQMGIEKPESRQCTSCHAQRNPERADR